MRTPAGRLAAMALMTGRGLSRRTAYTWAGAIGLPSAAWRHVSAQHREERTPARKANDVWSMEFVVDQLADGRRFRLLTIVDLFTRECLDIEIGSRLRAEHVVAVLNKLKVDRGVPKRIY
jgi:transposase InsO family protein